MQSQHTSRARPVQSSAKAEQAQCQGRPRPVQDQARAEAAPRQSEQCKPTGQAAQNQCKASALQAKAVHCDPALCTATPAQFISLEEAEQRDHLGKEEEKAKDQRAKRGSARALEKQQCTHARRTHGGRLGPGGARKACEAEHRRRRSPVSLSFFLAIISSVSSSS